MSDLVKYRSDIDGLRAIAVLSVIIFHLNSTLLAGGFVGVDIFFVISGFLITKILLREIETHQFSFSGFYIRRIRRIFPALFVVLFFSLLMAILVLGSVDLIWFCKTLKYSALQLSNFLFQEKVEYFDTKFDITPLLHTWSLGVEEQFYVVFPPLLYWIFKSKKDRNFAFLILIILSLASLVLSQFLLIASPKTSFFSLASRFWELGLGGLLAFSKIKQPPKNINEVLGIGGLLLIITSLFITDRENFPGIYALPSCLGAALVIFSGQYGSTIAARFLGNKILVFFGLISYSLYLWHYPIIEFYKELAGVAKVNQTVSALLFLLSTVLAYLSYKYVETPFRKTKSLASEKYLNFFKIRLPFIVSLGAIAFFLVAATVVKSWQEHRREKIFGDSAEGKLGQFNSDCLVEKKVDFSESFIEKCVKGEKKKEFEVLLVGDSHAWRYSSGLLKWATKKNYSMAVIASTKCPSFIDNGKPFCKEFFELINRTIQNNKNLKYLIFANKWDDDVSLGKTFSENLSKNIENFSQKGRQIVILGSVSIFKFDPVKCISKNHALIYEYSNLFEKSDCEKDKKSEAMPENDFLTKFFSEMVLKNGIKYFDPKSYLCDKDYCYSVINGQVLYTDFDHLDFEGSSYVAKYFDF